ncbi:MAG: HAMP domain-containing protein [Clostridiales Family XIII bacterium]|jgi:signal transduction histidine kinase|nr:HAMP domain-containing protein [Clostridiales Family XIII bacterium]
MAKTSSLRSRISLSIAIVTLLAVALICLLSNVLLDRQFERYAEEERQLRAADIAQNISTLYYPVTKTWDADAIHALGMYSMTDGYIVVVKDADGTIVWDAQNHDMARCAEIMDDIAVRMEKYGAKGEFTPHDFTLEQNGREVGTASVMSYGPFFFSEADAALLDALNRILIIVGLIALAVAVVVGFALARRVSKPALDAAKAAERIAGGDFAARVDAGSGIRELDELIGSVNRLASDLGKQQDLRKRLTADMAHELRTPLAAISVQIESMAEGAVEPTPERLEGCRDEIRRITNLLARLDRLEETGARKTDAARLVRDTDVTALVRSVCAAWEIKAAQKNIGIDIEDTCIRPVSAKIDCDAIAGAISNLISNAVKYSPDGGRVRIGIGPFRPNIYRLVGEKDTDDEEMRGDAGRVGANSKKKEPTLSIAFVRNNTQAPSLSAGEPFLNVGVANNTKEPSLSVALSATEESPLSVAISSENRKSVVITVEDTGPGIPEDELPYIFERLYRADKSRNRGTGGAGIGLAIAQEAIAAHGGSITADNAPGGGAIFTIVL